ncbi:paladin-like isoform X2 [Haliotis asinina]|uniref:paladin-like isoform X2 n=1 Tax=Haliotis asinina TaxID=109174 RepID=UPI00353244B8
MGSAASNISPPPSPISRNTFPQQAYRDTGNGQDHVLKSRDQVAPIVIKDCREEFQRLSKFKDPIVMGKIADGMPRHPLVKGKYFLVTDGITGRTVDNDNKYLHSSQSTKSASDGQAPDNCTDVIRTDNTYPVYGCAQPDREGVLSIVQRLITKHTRLILFNTREEAVLFPTAVNATYTIRHADHLHDIVNLGQSDPEASEREARIRKEVVDLSTLDDVNKFYIYNNITCLDGEPHVVDIKCEDDILVAEEVYTRLCFTFPDYRTRRLCFPVSGAPSMKEIDSFLAEMKLNVRLCDPSPDLPAVLFVCDNGKERTTLGMVLTSLLYTHLSASPVHTSKTVNQINDRCPHYGRGEFQAVRELVRALPEGALLKHQVDTVIDQCSSGTNLRSAILQTKQQLETSRDQAQRTEYRSECSSLLERYITIICFNAYLKEQVPWGLSITFSQWMQTHPDLVRITCRADNSERSPQQLLIPQTRVLVADDYIGLDVLGSECDVRVANFRKLMGLPIYGMAQAPRDGLSRVVSHLLDKRQGYKHVAVIGLRNDVTVECDGATYNVRDVSNLEEPVLVVETTASELEDKEEALKKEVKSYKDVEVYTDTSRPPVTMEFSSVMSPEDLWEQQKLQTLDMSYTRLPIQYDHSPTEKELDQIQAAVCSHHTSQQSWNEDTVGLVFTCRTGKSRTSLAMAVAGLIFYHKRGIPYGARPGEEERVSCPNAAYTQGDFIIVQKLVRLLPEGQQVKREVDLVLDQVFETMSPMHFHLREVIFVTYNKIKSARTESQRQSVQRLSVEHLERYLLLILYNAYLHHQKGSEWNTTFSHWMCEVAARVGVYELLDNLAFYDFEQTLSQFRTRRERWRARRQNLPFHGHFI